MLEVCCVFGSYDRLSDNAPVSLLVFFLDQAASPPQGGDR